MLWPETTQILRQEGIGDVPARITLRPLRGICIYNCKEVQVVPKPIGNVWRHEFDYWLTERAMVAGAELWQQSLFQSFETDGNRIAISLRKGKEATTIQTRALIGADGGGSLVRRNLFPRLEPLSKTRQFYRPILEGTINLSMDYLHYSLSSAPVAFHMVPKTDDVFLLGPTLGPGENAKQAWERLQHFAAREFGLSARMIGVQGCALYGQHKGEAPAGVGNVLLAGDALGVAREYGEAISSCLASGIEAGKSVVAALNTGTTAAEIYSRSARWIMQEAKESRENWHRKEKGLLEGTR